MKEGYVIQFSLVAVEDLENLLSHVQPHALPWARRTNARALKAVDELKRFPRLGTPYLQETNLRSLVRGPFRIFYEINDATKTVRVVRFWSTIRGDPSWEDLLN
jgi:plasmid stabilization system protein ParE